MRMACHQQKQYALSYSPQVLQVNDRDHRHDATAVAKSILETYERERN